MSQFVIMEAHLKVDGVDVDHEEAHRSGWRGELVEANLETNSVEDCYESPLVPASGVESSAFDAEIVKVHYHSADSLPYLAAHYFAEHMEAGVEAHAEAVILEVGGSIISGAPPSHASLIWWPFSQQRFS